MFRNMLLVLALMVLPMGLKAQTVRKDTSSTEFCRIFRYAVPNDTLTRRDTTGVSRLVPKVDSTCAEAPARTRTTAARPAGGAPRTPSRVVSAPQALPAPKAEPSIAPAPTPVPPPYSGEGHGHSDTTVVFINHSMASVDRGPSRLDRFFAHVEKYKRVYGVAAIGLTVWCIKACGGETTQSTTVIVSR